MREGNETHRGDDVEWEDKGRGWRDVTTNQGTPTTIRSYKGQGTDFPQSLLREHSLADTMILAQWY